MNELREMIIQERDDRKDEAKTMDDFFRSENDQRKKNLDDVNEWIRVENEKRLDLKDVIFHTQFSYLVYHFDQTKRSRGAQGKDGEREKRVTRIHRSI